MISNNQELNQFIFNFLISGVSAAISKTIASPIQVIKIRLQLQGVLIQKQLIDTPYKGIIDCFKRLYHEEGFKAYFKGNFTNVIRYFPTQALNFSFKDFYGNKLGLNSKKKGNFWQTLWNGIICGSAAGASTQFIVYPMDYTRTRLTNDIQLAKLGNKRQYNGIIDCMRQTYNSDGMRGLYRGFVVTCVFMMIYRGIYFGLNDSVKQEIPTQYLKNIMISFLVGYGITVTSGIIAYPLDTVRRRMMMSSGEKNPFTSSISCIRKMYKQNGIRSFFGGVGANVMRGVTGAGVLTIYDKLQMVIFGKTYGSGGQG